MRPMRILFATSQRRLHDLGDYIRRDLELLSRHYEVQPVYIKDFRGLFRAAPHCEIYYTWYCVANAFILLLLRNLFGKRLVVVSGGYDVTEIPEIGYGLGQESWIDYLIRRPLRDFTIPRVDRLLAFSHASAERAHLRGASSNLDMVYCSVDTAFFTPPNPDIWPREPNVLTVGTMAPVESRRKGLFAFIEAAPFVLEAYPQARFCLAGRDRGAADALRQRARDLGVAVELVLNPGAEELRSLYRAAHIYVQASAHEGFGISLAEAMACGCLPVGTRRGAIPEVIGPCGKLVDYGDSVALAEAIVRTLRLEEKKAASQAARAWVVEHFSEDRRVERLAPIFNGLIKDTRF